MKQTITLNTTKEVDPYNGMSTGDFDQITFRYYGYDFWVDGDGDPASDKEHDKALAYYFNLWNDTLKHGAKTGVKPCFDTFMEDTLTRMTI